jgi:hypothetical protein
MEQIGTPALSNAMAYRVFTAPAEPNSTLPKKPDGEVHQFRRMQDALDWARSLGRDMRAVLTIDEQTPAKVTVRSREDAARTTP